MNRLIRDATASASHILLKGIPKSVTTADVRRAIMQVGLKGVSKVNLTYVHCRPTGKALLTMSSPEFTRDALRNVAGLFVAGSQISAEPVYDSMSNHVTPRPLFGDGPSAGVAPGKTVTLCGLPGKAQVRDIWKMLKDIDVKKINAVPLPARRFSLYSRFNVTVNSESEAQRLVRKFHMTPYKGIAKAPIISAAVIY